MIEIHTGEIDGRWYGLARCGEGLVSTAAASTREEIVRAVARALPRGVERRHAERKDVFAEQTIRMLAALERGDESAKRFTLASEHVPEGLARVLTVAAAIPVGFVTSYGQIARTAGTEARVVGRTMASNPLYPIVPCHRVVGADLSLVGYGGRTSPSALAAKLARLRAEMRSLDSERAVPVAGGLLRVYPVERVVQKADQERAEASRQRSLFDEQQDG